MTGSSDTLDSSGIQCTSSTISSGSSSVGDNHGHSNHQASHLATYKLVGDNIDKDVKPQNMTCAHQTRSLHYFHTYAVKDHIDLSHLSIEQPVPQEQD